MKVTKKAAPERASKEPTRLRAWLEAVNASELTVSGPKIVSKGIPAIVVSALLVLLFVAWILS